MIVVLADSLRYDFAVECLKGVFPEESWSSFEAIETFTAPVLASVVTGKPPEVHGVKWWTDELNPEACDDLLFDHFESYVTISRLIGNGPKWLPPSRRIKFNFLQPIEWNAVSNNDDDVLEYVGRKWSIATNEWWDLIFYHSWLTHGPWGIDCYGPAELPCIKNCDRLMARLSREELRNWYKVGVLDFKTRLMAFKNISNNLETVIVFADHGELLKDDEVLTGHFKGATHPAIKQVPIWINRKVQIPEDISHTKLKDFIIEMYKKFELDNSEYQEAKEKICSQKRISK